MPAPKMRRAIAGKTKPRVKGKYQPNHREAGDTPLLALLKQRKINCMVIYVKIPSKVMWISTGTLAINISMLGADASTVLREIEPHLDRVECARYETSLGGLIRGVYNPWKKHARDTPKQSISAEKYLGNRQCQRCGQYKDITEFCRSTASGNNLDDRCQACLTRMKKLSLQSPFQAKHYGE